MPYYLLRLDSPRPSFPADATKAEFAAMALHAEYWQRRADAGQAIAVGPVLAGTGSWGLALVHAADEAGARALADGDPVLTEAEGFSYQIVPMGGMILPRD